MLHFFESEPFRSEYFQVLNLSKLALWGIETQATSTVCALEWRRAVLSALALQWPQCACRRLRLTA